MKKRAKDPAAVALGKKRWTGKTEEERKAHGAASIATRWENATDEERKAQGKRLADARAAAKAKKEGNA